MKPGTKTNRRESESGLERIEYCRGVLLMKSFLTDAENKRVRNRIKAWCARNNYPVEEIQMVLNRNPPR